MGPHSVPYAEPASATTSADNVAHEWLRWHARTRPGEVAFSSWRSGAVVDHVTYAEAAGLVDELARGLIRAGVRPGDRVVLALPNEPSFALTLLACMAAGATAVPGPIPTVGRTAAFGERLAGIAGDCTPRLAVTRDEWLDRIAGVAGCPALPWTHLREPGGGGAPVENSGNPVALLQYTSGSTTRPRGIVVTHAMLAASCAQAAEAYRERPGDVAVTWVPLYHDMGLITAVLRPLHMGYRSVLLPTDEFVADPGTWLAAVSACGGTLASAPNFAYDLCVRKVDATRVDGLDLRSWRVARNAGEVVRAETMDRFTAHFAPAGFAADAFAPSYGLAEATLVITTCGPGVPPRRLAVDGEALHRGEVVPAAGGTVLVSSGVAVRGTEISVTSGPVGTVAVRGPQLSPGHWGAPDRSPPWHATGDLGFLHDGHLFVLGRADDTVVANGRNHYLADVVAACASVPGLRPGRVAPFALVDQDRGTQAVHLVAELRPGYQPDPHDLAALSLTTKRRLASAIDLFVTRVDFVSAGALPVTTSGKVRASESRRRFEAGELPLLGGA